MADVRGMRELGASLNQAADTFGNLAVYAPDGLKQTSIAAGTAKAQNDLNAAQSTAADTQAMQDWQTAAADRNDFGTEDYANDKVKFLQNAGASPAAITKAQMDAQQATHTGQMQDLTQDYVYNAVTDRVANELGQAYYKDYLRDLQVQAVKDGATPQQAADKMRDAAIQAGRNYMTDKGIAVNIDHTTGNIMAMDKDGNKVPIDPDIAAQAYKLLGQNAPWNAMQSIQNETLSSGKALGTMAAPSAAAAAAATPPGMTPAQAMTQSKVAEATLRSYQLEQVKEANKAAAAVTTAGGTAEEADAAHARVMKRMQPLVDDAKKEVDNYHRIMSRTPAVQAMTAAPPPPPAPVNSAADAAALSGQQVGPPPSGATPAVDAMAAQRQAQPQSPQQVAQAAAQLVQNLHLDRQNLNSPEVQRYIATLDPQTQAALTELMNHIGNVQSVGQLPNFTNPRGLQ